MHHPDPNEKSRQQRMVKKDAVMRRLLAGTLSVSSLWQLMPLTATAQVALTAAGTDIRNTATGTYVDPNNPTTPINTTSNTVTATVAEVAGVTAQSSGTLDVNGGSVTVGDPLNYSFIITNSGNDATALHIPTTGTIVGGSAGTTALPVTGGVGVYVTEVNGIALTTPVLLPTSGNTTDATFITNVNAAGGNLAADGSIPIGSTIKVVVPVTVTATVAGSPVSVTLGNTGTYVGDVGTNTQNQPDSGLEPPATGTDPISQPDEIYTINVVTGGRTALPANGVREASAKNTQVLATQINNLALATVLKTRTGYSTNSTPTDFTDDKLTYKLDLRVESSAPAGSTGITPAPLLATAIKLDGAAANKILISDAIPVNTTIDLAALPAATVNVNGVTWTRVYSTAATTTSALDTAQNWISASAPTAATTRIGYIADGPIAAGYTTVGATNALTIQVVTTGLTAVTSSVTIANIAQVFGQTKTGPISTTNPLVYDESGDQNPNNYESGSPSVAAITDPTFTTTTVPTGVADPANHGTDTNTPGNNNTGTGPAGEDNVFTINPPGSILNGPQGAADAIGPNGNNTDFVNKSIAVPPNIQPGAAIGVASTVTFINTVQNPSTNTDKLDNVTLEPITATKAQTATGLALTDFELTSANNGAPLIDGTTVTIAYPVGSTPAGTGNTATYTLSGGATVFTLTSSTTNGTADTTFKPVKIASLAIGENKDYNVTVTLPSSAVVTTGYSVPIVAYVDSNTSNTGGANGFKSIDSDAPFNIKIDRVYTGYLQLLKLSRVIQGTGPAVVTGDELFTNSAKKPAPGNILEYLLTYKNISTPASGTSNVILNANTIVITEDGTAGSNNWAATTLNVPSSATVSLDGTIPGATTNSYSAVITFFNGSTPLTTTDTTVTKYINSVPTLTPGQQGFFRFQRSVK
jgi:hypothetical protein